MLRTPAPLIGALGVLFMITLNSEKELTRLDNWSEITDRPDYLADVDPKKVELQAIIGNYMFTDEVRCGLSSCHAQHKKGYLVSTKSGFVTNIGHQCGKTHFLVEFESLRRTFERDIRIKTQKETIRTFQSRIPSIEEQIANLKEGERGATWAQRNISKLRTPGQELPERIRTLLMDMANTGNRVLTNERAASDQEIRDLETIERRKIERPHYISEQVGVLEGIGALRKESDLRELLVLDLEAGIERLIQLDTESAGEHRLGMEARWIAECDYKLIAAEEALSQARKLLTRSNLGQLLLVARDEREKKGVKAAIAHLPDREDT